MKILAKVLEIWLNGVITSLMHDDQAGFMPNKSTAINLKCLFLNVKSTVDNVGSRALLSLDATKAIDSIDWNYLWAVGKIWFQSYLHIMGAPSLQPTTGCY